MGWLDRWLKRGLPAESGKISDASVLEAISHIVQLVDPRIALCPGYAARLEPAVRSALSHCIDMEARIPPAIQAGATAWGSDSQLSAFFATEADLLRTCSRSAELLRHFEDNPLAGTAFGALSALVSERQVTGPAIINGLLRQDVLQTTVNFSDHRLMIIAEDEARLRRAVSKRAFEELANIALARGEIESSARQQLDDDRALLLARRQMLERRGTGLGPGSDGALQDVEAEIEKNNREIQRIGSGANALERQLERLVDVLTHASNLISFEFCTMRLSNTNHLVVGESVERVSNVQFALVTSQRIGEPVSRAVLVIEVPRQFARSQKPDLDGARKLLL